MAVPTTDHFLKICLVHHRVSIYFNKKKTLIFNFEKFQNNAVQFVRQPIEVRQGLNFFVW